MSCCAPSSSTTASPSTRTLPLYPEERECQAPSTERILDTFAPLQRHRLRNKGRLVQTFEPELTDLHQQILDLLRLAASIFRAAG